MSQTPSDLSDGDANSPEEFSSVLTESFFKLLYDGSNVVYIEAMIVIFQYALKSPGVCVHVCVCVCVCVRACVRVHVHVCVHACIHAYVCVCVYMCMSECVCLQLPSNQSVYGQTNTSH